MKVTGTSTTGFEDAWKNALDQAPREDNVPRRYELKAAWYEAGGVVNPSYHCEVEVTGP
ncbi:hypothetical protein [Leifsonia sp. NPDC080035]|uniref:Dodecin domain-containing protein n=1 Tax=Leifsonia sp. NPDC080035 TaxID=3143936 RepID=A0AAU7GD31_9MICO